MAENGRVQHRGQRGEAGAPLSVGSLLPPPRDWAQPCQLRAGTTQEESVPFVRPGDLIVGVLGLQLLCGHSVVSSSKALQSKEGSRRAGG